MTTGDVVLSAGDKCRATYLRKRAGEVREFYVSPYAGGNGAMVGARLKAGKSVMYFNDVDTPARAVAIVEAALAKLDPADRPGFDRPDPVWCRP